MSLRKYPLLIALALTCARAAGQSLRRMPASVALKPTPTRRRPRVLAARFLTRFHYKPEPLDATDVGSRSSIAISMRSTPIACSSLQSDVDGFAPQRDKLGDAIYDEDLSAPFAIFNLYIQRVAERTAYARELLKQGFDFSKDESYQYQREKAPWAKTADELNDVWRKRVKNDWLRLKLAGKKDAEHSHDARQALRQLHRPPAPAQQRRRVPDVHERLRDGDRTAHQLPRPARGREFRHRDEAVARRHRRGPAARRRLHGDPRDRARRSGRAVRQAQGRRSHRRRRPGRNRRADRRDRLAPGRCRRQDPRRQGHDRAPGSPAGRRRPGRQARHDCPGAQESRDRGTGGEKFGHRHQGRRRDSSHRRDLAADVLPGFRRAPPRRQGLQERHARRGQAARRPEEAERRRRAGRPAQQRRRLAVRSDRPDRPVHRQGPGRAGAQRQRPRRGRTKTDIRAWPGAVRSPC